MPKVCGSFFVITKSYNFSYQKLHFVLFKEGLWYVFYIKNVHEACVIKEV